MGKVVEGVIPTLFGGVSKQPPQVRQPNQLEAQTNALSSVITGGFEKRPGSTMVVELTNLTVGTDYKIHGIDRSVFEKTFVAWEGGDTPSITAFDALTGADLPVTIGDTVHHLMGNEVGVNALGIIGDTSYRLAWDSSETVIDWTFKSTSAAHTWKMEGSADNAVWNDIATGKTGTTGTFTTTLDAVAAGDHNYIRITITTAGGTATDTLDIWGTFKDLSYLVGAVPEDLQITSVADYTFITNRLVNTALSHASLNDVTGTITGTVQYFSDVVTIGATGTGNIYRIRGSDADGFGTFYVQDNGTGDWKEIVDPTARNVLAESTFPHQLVRSADGLSFTFSAASWDDRLAGDEDLNPAPSFIGRPISDIAFYRNRLALLSDETCLLSQATDIFNLFAEKATAVLDSDPIERGATATNVNLLNYATVFRKLLFLTSNSAQFELGSGDRSLSGETAEMDMSTTYKASAVAKPVSMGDVLYFPSKTEGSAVMYEYYFQDSAFSNTAVDITRHIKGYMGADIIELVTDPASTTMFVLTTAEQNALFLYRTFFDAGEKLQSSWSKYTFGATENDAYIQGIAVFDNWVSMVVERDDAIWLEEFPIESESTLSSGMPYMSHLDQRELLTGVYVAATDLTTFTTQSEHNSDYEVVEAADNTIPGNHLAVQSYPTATTLTVSGDHSAGMCYVGRTYEMRVELSKVYPRENDVPIVTGRLQLQDLTVLYENTGYFELKFTPDGGRDAFSYKFEGKVLGDAATLIDGALPSESGTFGHKKVNSRADTVMVEFISDEPEPVTITSVQWRGFFNETGRSG